LTTPVHRLTVGLALGAFATSAFAHGSGAHGAFTAGFAHPLTGLDHLLAMLAVGMWAGRLARGAAWTVASTFLAAVGVGFALAATGLAIPVAELGVIGSLLVFGLLVAFPEAIGLRAAAPLLAVLAASHGQVHGLAATGTPVSFLAGLLAASAVVIGVGMLLAHLPVLRRPEAARASA